MSLTPAPMAMGSFIPPTIVNPIEQLILTFNTNPYFIGLMMLLLNLGGRFIGMEISKEQEKVFQHPWVRRALLFTVLFVATRNIVVALLMTVFVLLLLSFLLNENSDLCLWKRDTKTTKATSSEPVPAMTPEETEIWRRLHEKQMRIAAAQETKKKESDEESRDMSLDEIYAVNLAKLQ